MRRTGLHIHIYIPYNIYVDQAYSYAYSYAFSKRRNLISTEKVEKLVYIHIHKFWKKINHVDVLGIIIILQQVGKKQTVLPI